MNTKRVNKGKLTEGNFSFICLAIGSLCFIGVTGCSQTSAPEPRKEQVFHPAVTQLPPKPVYNRLRWVHLPSIRPETVKHVSNNTPLILPMIKLDLEDATLEEASHILAATHRYGSYCASTIATKKITIQSIGTIDELADQIAEKADIHVAVDHDSREIRFTAGTVSHTSSERVLEVPVIINGKMG